jgi:hypothetical protein
VPGETCSGSSAAGPSLCQAGRVAGDTREMSIPAPSPNRR